VLPRKVHVAFVSRERGEPDAGGSVLTEIGETRTLERGDTKRFSMVSDTSEFFATLESLRGGEGRDVYEWIDTLAHDTGPASFEVLLKLLVDHDWRIQARAAAILGARQDPAAVSPLSKLLTQCGPKTWAGGHNRGLAHLYLVVLNALWDLGQREEVRRAVKGDKDLTAAVASETDHTVGATNLIPMMGKLVHYRVQPSWASWTYGTLERKDAESWVLTELVEGKLKPAIILRLGQRAFTEIRFRVASAREVGRLGFREDHR
jgi:hypothetical protein